MPANSLKKKRIPNAERRRSSIRSVLDAALELFVSKGFDATSMEDVARHAGMTKGAVYFYFDDKLALLHDLLERTEAELFDPIFKEISEHRGSAAERIGLLANRLARVGAERAELPLLHVLVSLEMHHRNNIAEARVNQTYERLHDQIADLIRNGQESGEFSRDASPKTQAALFVALIDGLLLEWHRWGARIDGPNLAISAQRMILSGLTREQG